MADRPTLQHPTAPPDLDAYLARFAWHPEPELIGYRDEGASRAAMGELGDLTWKAALDFLYGQAMTRAMGHRVVAEGVETEAQRDWLRAQGCDLAQGWLYGKADLPAGLTEWIMPRERVGR